MEKKQMVWPFLAIVAIVAVVGIVMLVMEFKNNSSDIIYDEEGNVVGEALKSSRAKILSSNIQSTIPSAICERISNGCVEKCKDLFDIAGLKECTTGCMQAYISCLKV